MPASLLVVEDKDSFRQLLQKILEAEGYSVESVADGRDAIEKLQKRRYSCIISDLRLPRADGLQVLAAAQERDPGAPFIMLTAYGTVELAVEAIKKGAFDFLTKPPENAHLLHKVAAAIETRRLRDENLLLREEFAEVLGAPRIVGDDPSLQEVSREIQRAAPTDATVLLLGESGTGKELFARAVHHLSKRKARAFVAINCAAIPETLLENELFGHEKGAYTGAGASKMGKFEMADGGTVFLDEIGDLTPGVQAKLLRVLQERAFERVGGTATVQVDVRIVAATNKDLKSLVEHGLFREDLWFRVSVFPVTIPPLRARRGDIPKLAQHFLDRARREMGKARAEFLEGAMARLVAHDWPGNVRELQNCIERAVILSDGDRIRAEDLGLPTSEDPRRLERIREILDTGGPLLEAVGRAARLVEELKIRETLKECGGNKTRAAQALGVSYKTLLNKIAELGIERTKDPGPQAETDS